MLVDMVKLCQQKGATVGTIIGDDDSTGISKVRQVLNLNVTKLSDKNHVRKNITKQLFAIKKDHKELSIRVIGEVTKNFNYMLSQNKGDPAKIGRGLKALVNHQFGLHSDCDSSWCGAIDNPSYQHRNLPYGRDLQSDDLKKALHKIFVDGLKSQTDKLAFLGSSQANESFNNILATKAPKYKHYSESSSLHYRLCSAVCQKNMGYTYVATVRICHIYMVFKDRYFAIFYIHTH